MKNKQKIILLFIITTLLFQNLHSAGAKSKKQQISDFKSEIKLKPKAKKPNYQYKDNEILVKYKDEKINLEKSSDRKKVAKLESNKNLKEIKQLKDSNTKILTSDKNLTSDVIRELENDPNIEYVEKNAVRYPLALPNDSFFSYQWALNNTGQTFPNSQGGNSTGTADADIDAVEAWNFEKDTTQEVIVAVIDTGARLTHEDLAGNIWTNSDEIASNGIDDDANGYIDDVHGWDFKDNDNDPNDTTFNYCYKYAPDNITCIDEQDISGHGTFISGIIAAVHNNAKGISGLSSKNKIRIMPIRFDLDLATEIQAIQYAQANGAKVINASFGAEGFAQSEKNAIDAFPGIFVAAAGNEGVNNESTHSYPSDYTSSNLISVASTDQNDAISSFSNYGTVSVDLGAPGQNITGTYHKNAQNLDSDTSYVIGDGTSFATPYVAGSAATLFSIQPSLTTSAVKNRLLSFGDAKPSLSGKTVTGKRLNLANSIPLLISGGLPTGTLAANTTEITISVQTDANATCKYAFTSDTTYNDPNYSHLFSQTGGTSHSKTLSYPQYATNGQIFDFYVRCDDGNGNINQTPYHINFTVAAANEPVIYDASPTGNINPSTTNTTLEFFTQEFVYCKLSTTPNTPYASMTQPLTDSGTYHSINITNLGQGNTYNYYVRCAYPIGNPNTTDFPITFTVGDNIAPSQTTGLTVQ